MGVCEPRTNIHQSTSAVCPVSAAPRRACPLLCFVLRASRLRLWTEVPRRWHRHRPTVPKELQRCSCISPVDERSRPQIDPFRLPSLCGKACGDRMPGVTTALNVSLGNEPCSPANNRAKIDASREYLGGGAGLALSHGAAITLGASSLPPWSQNWRPNTAK